MKKNKKFEIIEESRFLSKKEMDKSIGSGGTLTCGIGNIYKLCGGSMFSLCSTFSITPCLKFNSCSNYLLCVVEDNGHLFKPIITCGNEDTHNWTND